MIDNYKHMKCQAKNEVHREVREELFRFFRREKDSGTETALGREPLQPTLPTNYPIAAAIVFSTATAPPIAVGWPPLRFTIVG